jgi:hypothetical protein
MMQIQTYLIRSRYVLVRNCLITRCFGPVAVLFSCDSDLLWINCIQIQGLDNL